MEAANKVDIISTLPTEILIRIFELFAIPASEQSDMLLDLYWSHHPDRAPQSFLLSLLTVSKTFYIVAAPILYREFALMARALKSLMVGIERLPHAPLQPNSVCLPLSKSDLLKNTKCMIIVCAWSDADPVAETSYAGLPLAHLLDELEKDYLDQSNVLPLSDVSSRRSGGAICSIEHRDGDSWMSYHDTLYDRTDKAGMKHERIDIVNIHGWSCIEDAVIQIIPGATNRFWLPGPPWPSRFWRNDIRIPYVGIGELFLDLWRNHRHLTSRTSIEFSVPPDFSFEQSDGRYLLDELRNTGPIGRISIIRAASDDCEVCNVRKLESESSSSSDHPTYDSDDGDEIPDRDNSGDATENDIVDESGDEGEHESGRGDFVAEDK